MRLGHFGLSFKEDEAMAERYQDIVFKD